MHDLLDRIIGEGGNGPYGDARWRFWIVLGIVIVVAGLITGKI